MKFEYVKRILTKSLRQALEEGKLNWEDIQEIRLRVGQHARVLVGNQEETLPVRMERRDLLQILDFASNYSLHAYENELRQGFITIEGGHRVGVAGNVKSVKELSSMNIRVSHEVLACASRIFPYITYNKRLCHTLIVSPPRCGKTTLLRDVIRQTSDGNAWVEGCNVGVVDERSELAGCFRGIPQNDVGTRTDVLDGCTKKEGMLMLIRSMSPQVIAVDEIGGPEEVNAMKYAMASGVKMIVTVHGHSMEEIRRKPLFEQLVKEHWFERYIVLRNGKQVGEVAGIYDDRGSLIYKETR